MEVEQVLESARQAKCRINALLHGGRTEEPQRSRYAVSGANGQRRQSVRARILHDARHLDRQPGAASRGAGLDYYNHNWTPRRNSTAISSPPAPTGRLDTLDKVRDAGIGLFRRDSRLRRNRERSRHLLQLANLPTRRRRACLSTCWSKERHAAG